MIVELFPRLGLTLLISAPCGGAGSPLRVGTHSPQEIRRPAGARGGAAWAGAAGAEKPSRQEQVEILNQALRAFDQAAASEAPAEAARLYRQAAERFEQLVAAGIRNGKLEYNLGNTYLRLGDLGRAIRSYRRAERLIPGDANLKANLRFARSLCATPLEGGGEARLLRSLFFWHVDTSQRVRAQVAVVAFIMLWILLAVRLFVGWTWPRNVALLCGLLSGALAVSLAVRGYQEGRHQEGVLVQPDTVVRKGNGAGYEQQFNEPLGAGVEFTLLETRPDASGARWYRVQFPNGTQGWLPAEAAEII